MLRKIGSVLLMLVSTIILLTAFKLYKPKTPGETAFELKKITSGLQSPTGMADPNDGKGTLFVLEQQGLVRVIQEGKLLAEPLLDLRSKIVKLDDNYDERGLLGIALHPDFKINHKFYVFYSSPVNAAESNCQSIVAQFTAGTSYHQINAQNEKIILSYNKPEMNHDGGQLAFGHDGMLYIGIGDGGGAGDEHGKIGNGQNLSTFLGKILRVDVNHGKPYSIPADNPFKAVKNAKPEIYAYGLRNPWRFSFDMKTTRLFCGDVGQDKFEEVDLITRGGNYGWRKMEATHCYNPAAHCKETGMILPINEYSHPMGISITGGYVYRGSAIQSLVGKYIFADWSGPLFCLSENNNHWVRTELQLKDKPPMIRILSMGQDHTGEIYYLTSKGASPFDKSGTVYKLVN